MKRMIFLFAGSMILFTGCGRDEPVSYLAPKEPSSDSTPSTMGASADARAVQAAHAAMSAQTPAGPDFAAALPEGWTENPGSGMRKVSYSIDGTSIDFYLISLAMGDITSNVNRWRGQVGLTSSAPEDIAKDVQPFQIDGHDVNYIEIYNEEGGKGIIAAIIDLAPQYWYFTAKGSVDELKSNAEDIRNFLQTIKFKGHNH